MENEMEFKLLLDVYFSFDLYIIQCYIASTVNNIH